MAKRMWMLRSGRDARNIEFFREKKIVAVGWVKDSDFSKLKNKEGIKSLFESKYPEMKKGKLFISIGQASRFLWDFKIGDYIVSYDPNKRVYLVGTIESEYFFDSRFGETPHTRKVNWIGEVGRDILSASTRNTLGSILTIFEVNETAETEILTVLGGKKTFLPDQVQEAAEEEGLKEDMAEKGHELIRDKVLRLDWEDMEKLVAGILRAMGYKSFITERGSDRGKDIEASRDGLMLEEPRILVEVKHRGGQMGTKEIRNFQSTLRGRKGLYVSTGGFSKEAKYEAERSTEQLTLIDADRLVNLIIEYYDSFDVEAKLLVPLTKIYWPT